MRMSSIHQQPQQKLSIKEKLQLLLKMVLGSVLIEATILFVCAGDLTWGIAWVILGLRICGFITSTLIIQQQNPNLIVERSRGITEKAKSWDKLISTLINIFYESIWLVAGLDHRFRWSPEFFGVIPILSLIVVAFGFALFTWAMLSNRYFTSDVRIQHDRGHTVETSGPYQYLRHPGYAGFIPVLIAIPLVLNSLWALLPGGLTVLLFIIRTALEDKMLLNELVGYREYASKVRYRLLPAIW